jgi:uncharacterized protein (DUF427 family)
MKAIWKDRVIAQSENTVQVEGNHYFPMESVNMDLLEGSETHTTCPWKGEASYYDIRVNGEKNRDAAWYYPSPSNEAISIKDHVAFWKGVQVVD